MMTVADFALMSDPGRNRNFSRRWVDRPPKRERRPGQGAAHLKNSVVRAWTAPQDGRNVDISQEIRPQDCDSAAISGDNPDKPVNVPGLNTAIHNKSGRNAGFGGAR